MDFNPRVHAPADTPADTPLRARTRLSAAMLGLALLAAGCGGDAEASTSIEVDGAWARTSPMNVSAGAAYFSVTSDEAITIVSASVPADVAATVELHEVVMADMGEMDESHDDHEMADEGHDHGAMKMQELTGGIDVAAGETVELAPGGLHVMLLDLPDPLELGETFTLTLILDDGETVDVDVEVRDEAP